MEENDYRAYIASSSEGSDQDDNSDELEADDPAHTVDPSTTPAAAAAGANTPDVNSKPSKKSAKQSKEERRAKLRELLLNNDELPEGWGNVNDKSAPGGGAGSSKPSRGDLEVTFTPGLSTRNQPDEDDDGENETTLERYQRRQREKKAAKQAKKDAKDAVRASKTRRADDSGNDDEPKAPAAPAAEDDFFDKETDDEDDDAPSSSSKTTKKTKSKHPTRSLSPALPEPSTTAELALLLAPENAANGPKHFDMKEVIRTEKMANKKGGKNRFEKRKEKKGKDVEGEVDEGSREDGAGFAIDVADSRFTALHEEPEYAIDPSHPQCVLFSSILSIISLISLISFPLTLISYSELLPPCFCALQVQADEVHDCSRPRTLPKTKG